MQITIEINAATETERLIIHTALQNIAKNIEKDNLLFMSELASKPGMNAKLRKNQNKIRRNL